jgi:hypothetical protein
MGIQTKAFLQPLIGLLLGGLLSISSVVPLGVSEEQPVAVTGTKVRLIPPQGFKPAALFPGYEQAETQTSIMVTELPGPFSQISTGLSNGAELKKRGLTLLSQEQPMIAGQKALLIQIQQTAYGQEFLKWILVMGNEKDTVMVVANFPKEQAKSLSEPLKRSILTTQWDQDLSVAPDQGLNFRLREQGDLKFARRISNAVLYSKGGVFPSPSVDDPIFVVAPSFSQQTIFNPERFAQNRALATEQLTAIQIQTTKAVMIADLNGYEILARGQDKSSGTPMTLYQVILFKEQTYYVMQGLVSVKHEAHYLLMFRAIAQSFQHGSSLP